MYPRACTREKGRSPARKSPSSKKHEGARLLAAARRRCRGLLLPLSLCPAGPPPHRALPLARARPTNLLDCPTAPHNVRTGSKNAFQPLPAQNPAQNGHQVPLHVRRDAFRCRLRGWQALQHTLERGQAQARRPRRLQASEQAFLGDALRLGRGQTHRRQQAFLRQGPLPRRARACGPHRRQGVLWAAHAPWMSRARAPYPPASPPSHPLWQENKKGDASPFTSKKAPAKKKKAQNEDDKEPSPPCAPRSTARPLPADPRAAVPPFSTPLRPP